MKPHLALIKVGGSFITDKATPFTAKPTNIEAFASQFAAVFANNPDVDFIVGNGVGSFAHVPAHQYGLRDGAQTSEQFYGLAVTHNGARRINTLVADALTGQQVPAYGLSPSAFVTFQDKATDVSFWGSIDQLLSRHCVPLLHGDTILDSTRGTTIASTETVLQLCLEQYRHKYGKITVIYVMNTAGVLDEKGQTIPQLKSTDSIPVLGQIGHDVTGSITGKVASARQAATIADAVYLVAGADADALDKCLQGAATGTRVHAE